MNVTVIKESKKLSNFLKVCAYARVSRNKESLVHSFNAQVEYYQNYIKSKKEYIYKGVFADLGISGTKDNREQFNKMIEECKKGNIDLIITKSISRFARNTATLLRVVRELKALGVNVYFEEQNIYSISTEGELILTLLATMAQEEARDMSENVKWTILKRFSEHKVYSMTILGYRIKNGVLVVEPEEAEIVKKVFELYLSGMGANLIAIELNKMNLKSRFKGKFSYATIRGMLLNKTYTGDLLLQTTYRENFITKKTLKNKGQKRMWLVEDAHEPIIDKETFNKVQIEIQRRSVPTITRSEDNPFKQKIRCPYCNRHFSRKHNRNKFDFVCCNYDKLGKSGCPNKKVPLDILERVTAEVLGLDKFDSDSFLRKIDHIDAFNDSRLVYFFKDGKTIEKTWTFPSRSESWTPEMKEKMRQKTLERNKLCQK